MTPLFPTLKDKFYLQVSVILTIITILAFIILQGFQETRILFADMTQQKEDLAEIQEILDRHLAVHGVLSRYLSTGDLAQADLYTETMSFFLNRQPEEESFTKISQIYYTMSLLSERGQELISQRDSGEIGSVIIPSDYSSLVQEVDILINRSLTETFQDFSLNVTILEKLLPRTIQLVTITVLITGIIIVLSSAFIVFPVARRLERLTEHALSHSSDDRSWEPLQPGIEDEVGFLTNAYNRMSEKIYKKTRDLEALNKTLNQRVIERTRSLTEQRALISEQAERLDAIIDSIGEGVIVLDENDTILRMNHVAETIIGTAQNEAVHHDFKSICAFFKDDEDIFHPQELLLTQEVAPLPDNTFIKKTDDTKKAIAGVITRVSIGEKIFGSVIVLRDETERRNLDKIRSEFASVVSHQMRTPLSVIRWVSEEIITNKKKQYSRESIKKVTTIHNKNNMMIELVNNFIQLSKIDGKSVDMNRSETPLYDFVKKIAGDLDAFRKKHKTKLSLTIPKKLTLELDQAFMREVFYNLINNAIKYSPEKGEVSVTLLKRSKKAGMITLAVKDNGIGIPKEDQKNIFEKFYRAENAREKIEDGNGLGLYIVKTIVELHGGTMHFTSTPKGTTFFILLPTSLVLSK